MAIALETIKRLTRIAPRQTMDHSSGTTLPPPLDRPTVVYCRGSFSEATRPGPIRVGYRAHTRRCLGVRVLG